MLLEVILKSDVEIERIGSIDESDADESGPTRLVPDANDKIASRVRDALDGRARVGIDWTGRE